MCTKEIDSMQIPSELSIYLLLLFTCIAYLSWFYWFKQRKRNYFYLTYHVQSQVYNFVWIEFIKDVIEKVWYEDVDCNGDSIEQQWRHLPVLAYLKACSLECIHIFWVECVCSTTPSPASTCMQCIDIILSRCSLLSQSMVMRLQFSSSALASISFATFQSIYTYTHTHIETHS